MTTTIHQPPKQQQQKHQNDEEKQHEHSITPKSNNNNNGNGRNSNTKIVENKMKCHLCRSEAIQCETETGADWNVVHNISSLYSHFHIDYML